MATQSTGRPQVVIIGGGFGGLYAARALKNAPVDVTIVDRRNHHLFQPLLYQVATAALSPANIAQPIRSITRHHKNLQVFLASADAVLPDEKKVRLSTGFDLPYDHLIVAAGVTHAYFGHDEWAPLAPGLKTLEDAVRIRNDFLMAFERAELESDPAKRRALLTFVIVGAGPTGVELAGTMVEMARRTLSRDFDHIDPGEARIIVLEGAPRVLPTYPEDLSESALRQLRHLGVEVRTGALVTKIEKGAVYVGDERIATNNVFWAAGVSAAPVGRSLGVETDRAGRVVVKTDLSIEGHPEVFVIGDLAACTDGAGRKVPGVAPAAMQMGTWAAHNIQRDLAGQPRDPFVYWDKGSLATIGRAAAVAEFGRLRISGVVAWLLWLLVHVFFLIGFENRVLVMIQWAWSYLSFKRGARLITQYDEDG